MGYDEIVDISGGLHKTGLFFISIYMHFRVFSMSKYRIKIFLGDC